MNVRDNIFMGREITTSTGVDFAEEERQTRALMEELEEDIDPHPAGAVENDADAVGPVPEHIGQPLADLLGHGVFTCLRTMTGASSGLRGRTASDMPKVLLQLQYR